MMANITAAMPEGTWLLSPKQQSVVQDEDKESK
jgi:hypothetical protein